MSVQNLPHLELAGKSLMSNGRGAVLSTVVKAFIRGHTETPRTRAQAWPFTCELLGPEANTVLGGP